MPKMRSVTAKKLIKILESFGFRLVRQRGSHIIMFHNDGRRVVVPMHGRDLPKGTLLAILKDAGVTKDQI